MTSSVSAIERRSGCEIADWVATGGPDDLPAWIRDSVGLAEPHRRWSVGDGIAAIERTNGDRHLRTVVLDGASAMTGEAFEAGTLEAYCTLLSGIPHAHLLRAWNFIPRINDDAGFADDARGGRSDRYMVFNAGRFRAFREVHGRPEWFPVASGVGHAGEDLVLHLLHGAGEPSPVDNPRQVLPADYSRRFGDLPPAFVRAAKVTGVENAAIVVSGTASVVGEDSLHSNCFDRQVEETLDGSLINIIKPAGWLVLVMWFVGWLCRYLFVRWAASYVRREEAQGRKPKQRPTMRTGAKDVLQKLARQAGEGSFTQGAAAKAQSTPQQQGPRGVLGAGVADANAEEADALSA